MSEEIENCSKNHTRAFADVDGLSGAQSGATVRKETYVKGAKEIADVCAEVGDLAGRIPVQATEADFSWQAGRGAPETLAPGDTPADAKPKGSEAGVVPR